MDLSAAFTDDQLAIIGCFAALAFCGLMATVSFHFGSAGKIAQPVRLRRPADVTAEKLNRRSTSRKAA